MGAYSPDISASLERGIIPEELQQPGDLSPRLTRKIVFSVSNLAQEMAKSGIEEEIIGSINFGKRVFGKEGSMYTISAGEYSIAVFNSKASNSDKESLREIRFRKKDDPNEVFISFSGDDPNSIGTKVELYDAEKNEKEPADQDILEQKAYQIGRFSQRLRTAIESGEDPWLAYSPSRRNFLMLSAALGILELASFACSGLQIKSPIEPARVAKITAVPPAEKVEPTDKETEIQERLLSEIVDYRNQLGLDGLPPELEWRMQTDDREFNWEDAESRPFVNDLPETMVSFGIHAQDIAQTVLGLRAKHFVWGSEVDKDYPLSFEFNVGRRVIHLPINVYRDHVLRSTTGVITHEAVGHATEPDVAENPEMPRKTYPLDVLIQVEHGKWRAVSQIPHLNKDAMWYPEGLIMPHVGRELGERTGRAMYDNNHDLLASYFDPESLGVVQNEVAKVAEARGGSTDKIIWTKKACREFGARLIKLKQQGEIRFSGDLDSLYDYNIGILYSREGYAELIEYSLNYPEKIANNAEVLAGITEVLSAIRGEEVDLSSLRQQISTPNQEAEAAFEKEKPLRVDDIVTPEERAVNFEEQWYQSFLKGQIREGLTLSSEQRTLLDLWAKSGYIVFQKYPNLINSDASGYNVDFDPEWMHIWETRDIEFAIARPIIVDIMGGADRVKHHFDWIKKALGNLEKFTSSQEFKEIPISTQNQ